MRSSLVHVVVTLLLAFGLGGETARAQSTQTDHPPTPLSSPEQRAQEARLLYADGKTAYAQARYEEALALFERAYALSEAPALLFNMAQAHRLSGPEHCEQAVALYKSYLAALPDAENRREVKERLDELGACELGPQEEAPRTTIEVRAPLWSPPAAETAAEPVRLRLGPPLVTGAGIAVALAGAALYLTSYVKYREAERECPCYPGTLAKWETLTNVSYAALAVGSATAVAGVSWWVLGTPQSSATSGRVAAGVRVRF